VSGSAGSSASGGAVTGGNGSGGGNAGTGGAGGSAGAAVTGQHCLGGPVLKFPEEVFSELGSGPMSSCLQYKYLPAGSGIAPGASVYSIELPSPATPGTPYAFSIKVTAAPTVKPNALELWGADEKCGAATEKLYSGIMKAGILCVTLEPTASHSRLLMAWVGDSGTRGSTDIAICPGGSCAP
jgi:hypothetical protein